MALPPAHRIARYNYPTRTAAFAYTFLVLGALWIESGKFSALESAFAAITFLAYPHLAYLHTRIAVNSKQAELNNLYIDCMLLGAWVAQMQFPLWPIISILGAVCLNSAGHGSFPRLLRSLLLFGIATTLWGATTGYVVKSETGPMVTMACAFGILAYVSVIGALVFRQNKDLIRTRSTLHESESQFRFIADQVGELVAVLDAGGRFLYAGTSHRRYFDPGNVVRGADWIRLVHPDDQDRAREFLGSMAAASGENPHARHARLRLELENGATRSVVCHGNPVQIGENHSKLIVLVAGFLDSPQMLQNPADASNRKRVQDEPARLFAYRGMPRNHPS